MSIFFVGSSAAFSRQAPLSDPTLATNGGHYLTRTDIFKPLGAGILYNPPPLFIHPPPLGGFFEGCGGVGGCIKFGAVGRFPWFRPKHQGMKDQGIT